MICALFCSEGGEGGKRGDLSPDGVSWAVDDGPADELVCLFAGKTGAESSTRGVGSSGATGIFCRYSYSSSSDMRSNLVSTIESSSFVRDSRWSHGLATVDGLRFKGGR